MAAVIKVTKEMARSRMGDVQSDKVFWCNDGRAVKNLDELVVALRDMSEDTFRCHATEDKNDFSNWIRDVIGDATLAKELQKAGSQNAAARKVEMRLDWLRARL